MNLASDSRRKLTMLSVVALLAATGTFVWYGPERVKVKLLELAMAYSQSELSALAGQPLPIVAWRDVEGQARETTDEPLRRTIAYVSAEGCSACEAIGEYLALRQSELADHAIEVRVMMDERAQPSPLLPREWIRRLDDAALLKQLRGLAYPTVYLLDAERRVESVQTGFSRELLQAWIDRQSRAIPVES